MEGGRGEPSAAVEVVREERLGAGGSKVLTPLAILGMALSPLAIMGVVEEDKKGSPR